MLENNSSLENRLLQNKYRLMRIIGQGGFGKTFLAKDESKQGFPKCVVKQFFPSSLSNNSDQALKLFRQEAERLKELGSHPQIPKLLDYFESVDSNQYIVQEFIDGQNLEEELAQSGTFSETEIRTLLNDLLPVLQFIHDHQVIHRDVKPANIIRRRKNGQLKLVDFGAAKYAATATVLAKTGTMIGSAEYVAPEQTAGKAVKSSDLYSLAVTCIHLLTSMPPFDLIDHSEGSWVWRDYLTQPVSEQLARILNRMLERGTKRRYQSAAEVLQDLAIPKSSISVKSEINNGANLSFWESPLPLVVTGVTCAVVTGLVAIGVRYHQAPLINQPPVVQVPHHHSKPGNTPAPVIKPSQKQSQRSESGTDKLVKQAVPIARILLLAGSNLLLLSGMFQVMDAREKGLEITEGLKTMANGMLLMFVTTIFLNMLFPLAASSPFDLKAAQQISHPDSNDFQKHLK